MKGVSSLVATVLLIALVVVIGMVIVGWATGFFKFMMELVRGKSERAISCAKGRINLLNVMIVGSYLSGKIVNMGTVNLSELKISLLYSNGTEIVELCGDGEIVKCEKSNLTLPLGSMLHFRIQPTSKPEIIYILTNCPEVNDFIKFNEICAKNGKSCSSNWQCCSECKVDWDEDPEPPAGWCCDLSQCAHDGICYNQFAVCKVGVGCYEQANIPPGFTRPYYRCEDGEWRLIV